ncbi:MAG: NAD(P)/FAD-dependent oxidoreductase [Sphingomonadaceae bacterium]
MERGFEPIETSHWSRTATPLDPFEPLTSGVSADVVVIGGGYTGLTAALHAAEGGKSVVLLEAEQPGWAASGRNAAQVCPFFYGATPPKIMKAHGDELGSRINRLIASSGKFVWDLIEKHSIDCNPRRTGHLIVRRTKKTFAGEIETAQQGAPFGLEYEVIEQSELRKIVLSERYAGGVRYVDGGLIQPLSFARGLAIAATRAGATIFGNSAVRSFEKVGTGWKVITDQGNVDTKCVLFGTGAYLDPALSPELAAVSYPILAGGLISYPLPDGGQSFLRFPGPIGDLDDQAVFSPAMDPEGRLMMSTIISGKDRTLSQVAVAADRRLKKAFPQLGKVRWERHWFGRFVATTDHLPRVVRLGDGMYAGTGDNGVGITYGTATGRELAKLALGVLENELDLPVSSASAAPLSSMMPGIMSHVLVPLANKLTA